MRIWADAKVDLLAVTQLAMGEYPEEFGWESDTDVDPDSLPEFAGRLCYLSFGAGGDVDGHATVAGRSNNEEYLNNIKKIGHGSVIEHSNFTFLFQGISRTLTHELVRHRHFSYSQLSQRYVDESAVGFVCPPDILELGLERSRVYKIWEASVGRSLEDYKELLCELDKIYGVLGSTTAVKKQVRQAARSVLGACAETKIVVTGNSRAWRHFLFLRGAKAADPEIRRLAVHTWGFLRDAAPNLFGDWHKDSSGVLYSDYGSF